MSSNCNHPTCMDAETCRRAKISKTRVPPERGPRRKPAGKKKKPESIAKLLGKAQKVFNAYIRERDSRAGYFICISCGKDLPVVSMNAGHYVPVSRGSYLRMHEWNVNGECQGCNCFDEFHLIGYRARLIEKIGAPAVKWLEDNRHTTKKWTRQEIAEIILKYSKQIKAA